jgi:hypothetical protein
MKCDCVEYCQRAGFEKYEDGSVGYWFIPYLPSFVEGHEIECKKLTDDSMKIKEYNSVSHLV